MKQKRGHYFLTCFDDSQLKIDDLKTNSEIPLSVKSNVLKFEIPKSSRRKSESLSSNLQKHKNQFQAQKGKSQLFSKPHSLCDLYHNPEYRDSECSIVCTIFRNTSSCPEIDDLQLL